MDPANSLMGHHPGFEPSARPTRFKEHQSGSMHRENRYLHSFRETVFDKDFAGSRCGKILTE
jgi:hypothetical protein